MKKVFYVLFFIILISNNKGLAQNVGINSTGVAPDASAGLDVNFSRKGVLIPRVDISDLTTAAPIASPATSLVVYNTNTTTGPGYFYWDGSMWVKLFDANDGRPWVLEGNAGTTPGTDFIGTTDNVDFVVKTNNAERVRIKNSGNVGIGTTSPGGRLEVNMGNNNNYFRVDNDNNIGLELRSGTSAGTPFIDFSNDATTDYDARIILRGNDYLEIAGTRVGIGTPSPTAKLHVNGSFRLTDGNQADGRVLMSDANGNATWQDLNQNTYGTNNQGVSGTTDITLNSSSFVDMDQMSITFTPAHNIVYVYFTFSAYADPSVYPMEYVDYRILRNGTTVGGGNCLVEDYDDADGIVTSFNGAMSLAVPVTPGSSTTIKVQWRRYGLYTSEIYCNPASEPDYSHRSLIIID